MPVIFFEKLVSGCCGGYYLVGVSKVELLLLYLLYLDHSRRRSYNGDVSTARVESIFFREDDYMESAAMELIASNNLPFSKCCATRKPLIWSMMACQYVSG